MKLVSIIIPVYNSEQYISRCINSIINQNYKKIEIICIDDGSRDSSLNIINDYVNKDNRIKVYSQPNSGPSIARNYGLDMANGEYITFCDSDDYLESSYIQELVQAMEQLDVDIVASGYIDISKYGTVLLNDFWNNKSNTVRLEFVNSIFSGVGGTLWGKLFKKEIISNNKLRLKPNIYMCEDMVFVLAYSMICRSYGVINQNLYNYYRLNENSISKKMDMNYHENLVNVLSEIEKILKFNNFDTNYIDNILKNRTKNMIISFLIMQHDKNHKYSKTQKIQNISYIINDKYTKKYINEFVINNYKEKLMINLMINKKYNKLNFYSGVLYYIQMLKDKVRRID